MPAEGVLAATVMAPSATLADALSTAFFVMGPERTAEFCESRPEIAALVVCPTHGQGKGDRHLSCEAPEGPFRPKVPVTFSHGQGFEVHRLGFKDELILSGGG
jgi:hypothetical protein